MSGIESIRQSVERLKDLRAELAELESALSEQRSAVDSTSDGADDIDNAKLAGARAIFLGTDTIEALAARWQDARRAERIAHAALAGAMCAEPGTVSDIARRTGAMRSTVRRAREDGLPAEN